jgi:hypothetical protein
MKRTDHARQIASRFRELVEVAGDTLPDEHYDELALLIEAGIDAVVVEHLEKVADELDKMSHNIRHRAEFFD